MKRRTSVIATVTLLMAPAGAYAQTMRLANSATAGGDQTIRPFHIPIAVCGELRGNS